VGHIVARPVSERPLVPQAIPATFNGVLLWSSDLLKQLLQIFAEYGFRLNLVLPKDGSEIMTGPIQLKEYTTATKPTASDWEGAVIYVSDGGAGAVFQGSNGTSWVNLG
jgi:hypothetical protein